VSTWETRHWSSGPLSLASQRLTVGLRVTRLHDVGVCRVY
jgi:hypothetical protein